ncbi:MAG: hypothetical protein JW786_11175 [Desulfobacterales bacterium]|nr:hypothetical protein [Desulfobacterales bacterium]
MVISVKISSCKNIFCRIFFLLLISYTLCAELNNYFACAEDKSYYPDKDNENQKIYIIADKFISDSEVGFAEFIGNVRVTQGAMVICAEKLKIYNSQDSKLQENPAIGEESIKKIIANGKVKITFDNRLAMTDQAEYITEEKILILSGVDSKVISGKNSISGTKITLYRADGRIEVEGRNEKRVEAIFYSEKLN